MALKLALPKMLAASAAANFAERFDIHVPGISFFYANAGETNLGKELGRNAPQIRNG
ncbi:hypothetical protein [Bradyrhizobium tropiciagri]|uniref:hypothetical protein n=1 Tax=Bradyrhizobium tropiciagri TaxID=312253 RepID=UPI0012FEDA95|nr:hypothetical protein [Bradyrhizobium tropiciagri]